MNVVKNDQVAVARRDEILFQVSGAHGVGERLGGQGVFRQVAARSAMRNDIQ
jgi:hypothetical protein